MGWWRIGFDEQQVPYENISTQVIEQTADLNAKYDVIVFPPGGGSAQSIIDGMPMWRNPLPWKKTALTPNIGVIDSTDDIRPGMGWDGLEHLQAFVNNGGLLITAGNTADFAMQFGVTSGVSNSRPRGQEVVGSLLRTRIVDGASPIAYGIEDSLAVYSDEGETFGVSNTRGRTRRRWAVRRRGRGARDGARHRGRSRCGAGAAGADAAVRGARFRRRSSPGRRSRSPTSSCATRSTSFRPTSGRAWCCATPTSSDLLVSGLLSGGNDIAQRAVVVDDPVGKGHVVLFANNPVYRGETIGSYALVFNAMMNWDNLNAGRVLDQR